MELSGCKVLVTGGGARLGRAIALALGAAGCDVALQHWRSAAGARGVATRLGDAGRRAVPIQADLSDPQICTGLPAEASAQLGGLDVLINNAGLFLPGDLASTTLADWESQMAINLRAPFLLSQAFAAVLGSRRGKIVNVADARVRHAGRGHLAYRVSKSALVHLTALLALDLAPRITVNAVAPGAMLPPPGESDSAFLARVAHAIPLRRAGGAETVAAGVAYLLREDFATGVVLPLDGGEYL